MRFATVCLIVCLFSCNSGAGNSSVALSSDSVQTDGEKLYGLAWKYFMGDSVEKDAVKAVDLMQIAAKSGHTGAECFLAYSYFRGDAVARDYDECLKWCARAAAKGDPEAQTLLGDCCLNGYGCDKDTLAAIKWYTLAVENWGYDEAGRNLHELGVRCWPYAETPFVKNEKYCTPE